MVVGTSGTKPPTPTEPNAPTHQTLHLLRFIASFLELERRLDPTAGAMDSVQVEQQRQVGTGSLVLGGAAWCREGSMPAVISRQ